MDRSCFIAFLDSPLPFCVISWLMLDYQEVITSYLLGEWMPFNPDASF